MMNKRYLDVFAILFFSSCIYSFASAQDSKPVIINFESRDSVKYSGWEAQADSTTIRRWAQTRGLAFESDREPLVDKKASFVSRTGSTVEISSLNPNSHYKLFIDFVSYTGGSGGVISRLVISGDGEKLAELSFGQQNGPNMYAIEIPRNLIYDGKVVISFDEMATTSGVWGIWDMILTERELPQNIEYKKELPVIKDSAGEAPDARAPKKGEKAKISLPKETEAKPAPKKPKEVKDVVEPVIQPVQETKSPDGAKIEPPKAPERPKVEDIKVKEPKTKGSDIRDIRK